MPLVGSVIFVVTLIGSEMTGVSSDPVGSLSAGLTFESLAENLKVFAFSFFRSSSVQPLTGQNLSINQESGRTCLDQLLLKKRLRALFFACSCWVTDMG